MQFMLAAFVSRRMRDSKWNNFIEAVMITVLIDMFMLLQRVRPRRASSLRAVTVLPLRDVWAEQAVN